MPIHLGKHLPELLVDRNRLPITPTCRYHYIWLIYVVKMEKWMNVKDGDGVTRNHLSPSSNDTDDARTPPRSSLMSPSKSPPKSSKSPSSPRLNLSNIPPDPRKWTSLHVGSWVEAVAAKYAFEVNKSDFQMNGMGLCLMKREGFLHRVPEHGTILFEDFRKRLRQYLTACRQRVRTTYSHPGTATLPGRAHHFPAPTASGASQVPTSPIVQPGQAGSQLIAPFSALRNVLDRNPSGVSGIHRSLHTVPPQQEPLPFRNIAPFPGNNPQPSGRNDHTFLPPPQAGPSASTTGQSSPLVATLNGQFYAAASHIVGASPMHPRLPIPGLPASTAKTSSPLHMTLPTSASSAHPCTQVTPVQSTSVSTSCQVHNPPAVSGHRLSNFPHMGNPCYLHHSPYYRFVPIYRTMRVVGRFEPVPYGYPLTVPSTTSPDASSDVPPNQPPNATPSVPLSAPPNATPNPVSESTSQSQASIASQSTTSPPVNQSQALDLSTSNSTRPAPSQEQNVPFSGGHKRIKTEPQ
ncbi:proline-rich protein 36-like isoform X2 [Lytechinus variegatus]|uniref:proline-rich protein 36-like isoform X2 n=1 Tax=Lytechinus variegatus TaxID=7654 RepID=UPI001BB15022|nr:proline-rich protein 36-like isoform X2 [Lytechinus variegatus]